MMNNPTSGVVFFNGVRWIDVTYALTKKLIYKHIIKNIYNQNIFDCATRPLGPGSNTQNKAV